MTTLPQRTRSALLVVDVQSGVVSDAYQRDAVVGAIGDLVRRARLADVPVVWVRHADEGLVADTAPWQIVSELVPGEDEEIVEKHYGDAFEDTTLENVLANRKIGRLVVVGAQTDFCIRSTLHGALARGYDTFLVEDAHTTEDLTQWGAPTPDLVIAHTNMYWSNQRAPGRTAGTLKSAEVAFAS